MSDLESANFSETAASNNAAVPNGAPELWFPSQANNTIREIMGAVKREWNRSGPTVTSGGSANAQTLTYTSAVAALVQGQKYSFIAGFTNTGATTLAVSGLTAKAVRLANAALAGGEIVAGQSYQVVYDGTAYQIVSPISTGRGGLLAIQVFTNTGGAVYTPTVGANTYRARVIGGGGGGGGCATTGAAQLAVGASGGGGGYAEKRGLVSAISGATVTAGAGGTAGAAGNNAGGTGSTSSIGAVITATGGAGGAGSGAAAAAPTFCAGVLGGLGASGDINARGEASQSILNTSTVQVIQPSSGGSVLGGSRPGATTQTTAAGLAGMPYGGGGTGGMCAASQTQAAGAAGGDGVVIIEEYS